MGPQCPKCRELSSVVGVSTCLASACALHTRARNEVTSAHTAPLCVTVVSVVLSSDAYRHSDGTQRDPSSRTAGDFGQSLASPHVLHPPVLYIQVLTVRRLLNTRPPDVPGACVVLRSDAYWHSEGPQCPNCRGIRSIAGVSACLASASALHTSAGSAASSAHVTPRWACGV